MELMRMMVCRQYSMEWNLSAKQVQQLRYKLPLHATYCVLLMHAKFVNALQVEQTPSAFGTKTAPRTKNCGKSSTLIRIGFILDFLPQ